MTAKQLRAALINAVAEIPCDPGPEVKREAVRSWRCTMVRRAFERHPILAASEHDLLATNILSGRVLEPHEITPTIVPCRTREDFLIFNYFSLWSSFPTTDRPGRRLKFLIRDLGNLQHPLMGICCLSSPVRQLHVRDEWIGWLGSQFSATRARNLVYVSDLSTCIALPPYSFLTGGKLLAGLMTSNETRSLYDTRYREQVTLRRGVRAYDLYLLTTSGCYGSNTPQYRGLRCAGRSLYRFIGHTRGYSHFQIDPVLYDHVKDFVRRRRPETDGQFRTWANSKIRVLRMAARELDIPEERLVFSGHRRGVFAAPLTENWQRLLRGEDTIAKSIDYPAPEITTLWKETWLRKRLADARVAREVQRFRWSAVRVSRILEEAK